MATRGEQSRSIKSTDTVFAVIESAEELDGATVTEIANHLNLAKSTVHSHLVALERNGYIVNEGSEFFPSTRFLDHGLHAAHRRDVYHASEPTLAEVAQDTGECAWISIEERGYTVPIRREPGERAVQTQRWLGKQAEMHTHAPGKAILAHLSEERVQEIIDGVGLRSETQYSITSPEELAEELEDIQSKGYAISDREALDQLRSVAAPILYDGEVYGAISVSGPANRLSGDLLYDEVPNIVLGGANAIELRLANRRQQGIS